MESLTQAERIKALRQIVIDFESLVLELEELTDEIEKDELT